MKVEYRNSTGLLAVIGDPIAHSLSPLLQNTMISALGRDELYLAIPVKRGALPSFIQAAKTIGMAGFNLTMPHKQDVIPFLDGITDTARQAGSVNSVRITEGKLEGHSTDGIGFRRALRHLDFDFPGKRVAILGAGGAARSIAMSAQDAGAQEIRIINRTLSTAQKLCNGEPGMAALPLEDAASALTDADILINTTPVGMTGVSGNGAFPYLPALKAGAPAVDCIYSPALTPFMRTARELGHPVANGIGMLVYQAIYAYAFFRNLDFDEATVDRLGTLLMRVSGVDLHGNG